MASCTDTMIITADMIKTTLETYMETSGTDLTAPGALEKLVDTIFDLACMAYDDGRDDGYDDGRRDGYDDGRDDGYDECCADAR